MKPAFLFGDLNYFRIFVQMTKKEEIKSLRQSGLTYDQIVSITRYSKSLIAYHLNGTTKEKVLERTRKVRSKVYIEPKNKHKLPRFLVSKIMDFKMSRRRGKANGTNENLFTLNEFFEKFGRYTKCYLTGEDIDLFQKRTYEFDHIVPVSNGGNSSLENLGITKPEANYAKGKLSLEEFYNLCRKVIKYNTEVGSQHLLFAKTKERSEDTQAN